MSEEYAWENKGLDEHAAKELYLFITNDGDLYRQQHSPINKNLTIKKARGVYNSALAFKLFMYLVDNGARKYVKDFGSRGERIDSIFPKPVRLAVAEELRDFFEVEHALGNYDQYIPKKYQASSRPKPRPRKRSLGMPTSLRGVGY